MKMQFDPYSERYYQSEKENMLYRISAMKTEPDGHTRANTLQKNRHLKRLCGQKVMIILLRRTEVTVNQEDDKIILTNHK